MKPRPHSGVADPVTLLIIAAFGLGVVTGTWKPLSSLFGKKPPTQQLTELQAKLDAVNRKGVVVSFVAHRARYKEGPLWVLQGDNFLTNPRPDAIRLSPDNFAGIVCDPKTLKPL